MTVTADLPADKVRLFTWVLTEEYEYLKGVEDELMHLEAERGDRG